MISNTDSIFLIYTPQSICVSRHILAGGQATVAEVGFDSLEGLLSALAELTHNSRTNYGRFGSASAG